MPTYEYACPHCGHAWDKREGFDASTTKKCPQCAKKAQRVLHAPPIVFKGSGFYVTDSRKPESTASESPSESSGAKTTKSDAGASKSTEPAPTP